MDFIKKLLIGKIACVDHPITCLNPTTEFVIEQIQFDPDDNRLFIKGKDTCWFGQNMIDYILNSGGNYLYQKGDNK